MLKQLGRGRLEEDHHHQRVFNGTGCCFIMSQGTRAMGQIRSFENHFLNDGRDYGNLDLDSLGARHQSKI